MIVSGFYNNGLMFPISAYAIEPGGPLKEGDVAIVVTSMDKTAVIPIKVSEAYRPIEPKEILDADMPIEWTTTEEEQAAIALKDNNLQDEPVIQESSRKKSGGSWVHRLFYPSGNRLRGDE